LLDSLDCWPLRLKDKHFIAMSLKDKTPCENQKMLNWPRVLNVASTKSIAAKFSPRFPFASWFFHFVMLDMFLVHVMLILYLLQTPGVQNMLLDMLPEVMTW